ncbi:uncharacterized protein LOC110100294 [Dendrobium catenatum]|uniref:uncharacterized protein LOC110100294 n=1 Tax=Dendrobium catenatum TaxID=906689 RepID=UPI0009F34716|nr:uncharacterized protein LOC110100294 [Dendrobium catenatum]
MGRLRIANTLDWEVAVVYADKERYTRKGFWEDISKFHALDSPLLVGGDFNCILAKEEKKGGRAFHFSPAASDMAEFMFKNDLIDPGFVGPSHTWTNNKDAIRTEVLHLTRLASDHCPIICCIMEEVKRSYSHWIKFEDIWASYPMAWQIVWEKWKIEDLGNESVKLQKKCQRMLKALFFWSKNKLKMLNQLKEELDRDIKALQEMECSSVGLTDIQTETLRYKVQLLNSTLARIMTWWRQRAKVNWIENGDDQGEILKVFQDFFQLKWRGDAVVEDGWPSLANQREHLDLFAGILDCKVTKEEIWKVLSACLEFFESGTMDPQWKETVVVLLPKVNNVDLPSKFIPISLCQTIYKIVAKVLMNGFKGILPRLISEEQAAFVQGCSISNNCASIPNVKKVSSILEDYCSWTGQKVNRCKSVILFNKSTPSSTRYRLAKIIGCRKVDEMEYLGIKFSLKRLIKKDFAPLLQQARSRTVAWGIRHLSMEGRVTLINSVLIPSSTYLVTRTMVPRSTLNEVEKICRSFLWDADANHKGIHYASWENIARTRKKGGLIFHANVNWVGPLRARITWDYISKPTCLLHKCLEKKYGRWPWVEEFKCGDSAVWKLICHGAASCCIRWKVCNRRNIDILNHVWIWDRSILRWPTFCGISAIEDLNVSELITLGGE